MPTQERSMLNAISCVILSYRVYPFRTETPKFEKLNPVLTPTTFCI